MSSVGQAAISVRSLSLSLTTGEPVVDDVSFEVPRGEILGVVGESGSGKSTVALALLGYTKPGVTVRHGSIEVGGERILDRDPREVRQLRGRVISYVPQDPGGALNPSLRVGDAILDVLHAHRAGDLREGAVQAALGRVELGDPSFARRYPHQLSGGQQQRVTIAMATVCGPPVAVLDEPTTGLDVLTQDRILRELKRLRAEERMAMVFVSHDLAVIARMADRVLVMYAGRVLEHGPAEDVIERPRHPYTQALVAAIPDVHAPRALRGIPGVSVGVGEWPAGCAFAPRCRHQEARCHESVPMLALASHDHSIRCVRWEELAVGSRSASDARTETGTSIGEPLLAVSDLEARYHRRRHDEPAAVHGVSFTIGRGQCVALVGESGSGKSTIGRCIIGLHRPSDGAIAFDGAPLDGVARRRPLEQRRRIQIVFQNPYQSLNPRQRVGSSIERPLRVLRRLSREEAEREVGGLLERVRLPARLAQRFPSELSGGERQRVAIARALAAQPDLLICDEITSSLDVSVQAAVLELLQDLRRDLHLSMLFITHNLGVVASIADTVLVMERGCLCETGSVDEVLAAPTHDYTRSLLEAAPSLTEAAVAG